MKINTLYKIKLYRPSKHQGGTEHIGLYSCGFWRTVNGDLIALHRDVESWEQVIETEKKEALFKFWDTLDKFPLDVVGLCHRACHEFEWLTYGKNLRALWLQYEKMCLTRG